MIIFKHIYLMIKTQKAGSVVVLLSLCGFLQQSTVTPTYVPCTGKVKELLESKTVNSLQ